MATAQQPGAGGRHYQTRQRELIRACLAERAGEFVTAREVCEMLSRRGCGVGVATVYRNLDRMVADGLVTRCSTDDGGAAGYRMVERGDGDDDRGERGCFYLRCEECGTLMPVRCQELDGFYTHFAAEHHVRIDPVKTVLYGTCPACTAADEATARAGADAVAEPAGAPDAAGERKGAHPTKGGSRAGGRDAAKGGELA
ncbi:MAG: transcriptional repressor [Coriobacteriales bacterium]|jgi:Fur family ferric uptake transcriptional regulator